MNKASTMLSIGSKYQKDGFTLIKSCDITMDMANTVEIKVFMTIVFVYFLNCFFQISNKSYTGNQC